MLVLFKINGRCTTALLRLTLKDRGEGIPPVRGILAAYLVVHFVWRHKGAEIWIHIDSGAKARG